MASFERAAMVATFGLLMVSLVQSSLAAPDGFVPGESDVYSIYNGTAPPYPANNSEPIYPTADGPAGADDLLFRNLLSAEWIVFNFYQQGVETFTAADFTKLGYKPTTYERIVQIRDNEAGHLVIFQDSISSSSIKPGPCQYDYKFGTDPTTYLVTQSVVEVTSMAFLTGLILQASLNATKAALLAIAEVESRHLTWGLIDVWNVDPFSGPVDTTFPYANQILEFTNQLVVPGSCPAADPVYPTPRQNLPQLANSADVLVPGSPITFTYRNASHVPSFSSDRQYYAVFYHGVQTISVPFEPATSSSVIPGAFENRGIIIAVIADQAGAPTESSVLAGPLLLLLQPPGIALG